MKPVRLQLRGFTAFHNEVSVDFRDRRLFAITGPTGAGKSSLLDGIIWALFGKVPKVGKNIGDLVSHGALSAHVRFEFEARGHAYRVARVRPVKGTTTARLERLHEDGEPVPLADSVTEVNAHIEHILGIDYETFVKTIILPQGEFSAFLSGDPKEKKDVLSRLLGLDVYRAMMQSANNRASGAQSAANLLQQQHDQIQYQSPEALTTLEADLRSAEARAEAVAAKQVALKALEAAATEYVKRAKDAEAAALLAVEARAAADAAARAAGEARAALEAANVSRETLSREIAALDYDGEAHDLAKKQLAAAEQLEVVRAHLVAADRALADAGAAEAQAISAAEQHRRAAAEAQTALAAARTALRAGAAPASAAAAALEEDASAAEAARAAAQEKSHDFELRANQLQNLAGTAIALRRDLEAADAEVQRATGAAATAEATRVHTEAVEAAATADLEAAWQHLDAARVQDSAAAILATLTVGDPCPVCGEPITDLKPHATADVTAAERALASAQQAHTDARDKHTAAGKLSAAAHAHADAARTSYAGVEEKQAALDEELAAASVTRASVDRSAKRASTAAAAERERAIEAQHRAEASKQAVQGLSVLLVKLPSDLEVASGEVAGVAIEDVAPLVATLGAAIEEHARASGRAAVATAALAEADVLITSVGAAVKTAAALRDHQAATVAEAAQALVALGVHEDPGLEVLRAGLEALDALAALAASLSSKLAEAERQYAAASAVLEVHTAACEATARAVLAAESTASSAAAIAQEARAAFEAEWRRQLPESAPDVTSVADLLDAAAKMATDLASEVGWATAQLAAAQKEVAKAGQLQEEIARFQTAAAVSHDLGVELQANNFVGFIQREAMGVLAADAGERMLQLSRDRYRLESDNNEFMVVDRLNGDERRSVRTLSGGETFLASLALALALSERLPELSGHGGALSLESLFLDEGFGSLDAESLDVAIEGLELLATGSRMIGVISHVPEVAERLPDRIEVVKAGGVSTVRDGR